MTKVDDCLAKSGPVQITFGNPVPTASSTWENYGQERKNRKGEPYYHTGLDIPVPKGTDVHAAEYGLVWRIDPHESYGKLVVLKHSDGLYSVYAHLDEVGVELDECVARGDRIGASGNTGRVTGKTGEHLHFEIIQIPASSNATVPRSGPNFGLASDLTYRLDPTFVFSAEHAAMLDVSNEEAFQRTKWGSLGVGTFVAALVAALSAAVTALTGGVAFVLAAGAGLLGGWIAHRTARKAMINNAQRRYDAVRETLRITVTPQLVQEQLNRAEKTGKMTALQRSKIYASMRRQIESANDRSVQVAERIDVLTHGIATLTKDLHEVERDIQSAKLSMDAERLKRAEARRQELEQQKSQRAKELDDLREQSEKAAVDISNANQRANALDAAERDAEGKNGVTRVREGTGNDAGSASTVTSKPEYSNEGKNNSGADSKGGVGDASKDEPVGIRLIDKATGNVKASSDPFDDELITPQ